MSRAMTKKEVFLMLIAEAIDRLAIQLAWLSWTIVTLVFGHA
jgi:hypothetical protein